MTPVFILTCVLIGFVIDVNPHEYKIRSCGVDNHNTSILHEGVTNIENYPWLGTLYYPIGKRKWMMTSAVVLVTKQIVIGSTDEFDRLPKEDIRARSRVVLGHKCGGPSIKMRDYSYHPEYRHNSYSALVMIQLELDMIQQELRPICAPPTYFIEPQIYAMTVDDCHKGKVQIYKMMYVDNEQCKQFYQKAGLDVGKFWPKHTVCARAQAAAGAGACVWRGGGGGTTLQLKQDGRWRLLGFGVHGPGCEAPARFLDYGMHVQWVKNSIARIGKPAFTKLDQNHLILRRTLNNLQRYGRCDPEEKQQEIYTDQVTIEGFVGKASYNITLYSNFEYSCVILHAKNLRQSSEETETQTEQTPKQHSNVTTTKPVPKRKPIFPRLYLRRWCPDPTNICYGLQYIEINLYVLIEFVDVTCFSIRAYGKAVKVMSPVKVLKHTNLLAKPVPAKDISYKSLLMTLNQTKHNARNHRWFYKGDIEG